MTFFFFSKSIIRKVNLMHTLQIINMFYLTMHIKSKIMAFFLTGYKSYEYIIASNFIIFITLSISICKRFNINQNQGESPLKLLQYIYIKYISSEAIKYNVIFKIQCFLSNFQFHSICLMVQKVIQKVLLLKCYIKLN